MMKPMLGIFGGGPFDFNGDGFMSEEEFLIGMSALNMMDEEDDDEDFDDDEFDDDDDEF